MKKIVIALAALAATAFAQGPLNPPAAPAPTMKTLLELWNKLVTVETQSNQIKDGVDALRNDPRRVITASPVLILDPGSYVLGANISVPSLTAILIGCDDVTLDLNGFTVSSTAAPKSGSGIYIAGVRRNIHIKNGAIRGGVGTVQNGGFLNGIVCETAGCANIVVSDVRVSGCGEIGISLGTAGTPGLIVERSSVTQTGGNGILAHSVRACDATDCGGVAIRATVVNDSTGRSTGSESEDHGIFGGNVINCRGVANIGNGIVGSTVHNSSGSTSMGHGIIAEDVSNSNGVTFGTGDGIRANNVANSSGTVQGNLGAGTAGIYASGTASYCRGFKTWGWALSATVAIGCTVEGGGTANSPSKHLGTP